MKKGNALKIAALFIGDTVMLYAALLAALFIRYGNGFYRQFVGVHFVPFTIVFIPWLVIFYVAGLYDLRRLRNSFDFIKTLMLALAVNAVLAVLIFYLVPSFGIAPKTNLLIFLVCFVVIEIIWRRISNVLLSSGEAPNRVVLVGEDAASNEIALTVADSPQLGYAIVKRIPGKDAYENPLLLERAVSETGANVVAVPRHLKYETSFALTLYSLFGKGVSVVDIATLYEYVLRKIPLADVEETWFIENIENAGRYYDSLKRAGEIVLALVLGVVLLPLWILIGIMVKLSSRGPALFKQVRVGQNGVLFTLYKFRTMREVKDRPVLDDKVSEHKSRVTGLGKVLRSTHLDELPQLINLLLGNISLVGPRPDFIDFYNELKEKIPYYSVRTIIKPGITGWAQVAFPVTESVEQTRERLCYDIYYLKNRSLILDILIIAKTLKIIATAAGK